MFPREAGRADQDQFLVRSSLRLPSGKHGRGRRTMMPRQMGRRCNPLTFLANPLSSVHRRTDLGSPYLWPM